MSADLHIHVCLNEEEERQAIFWKKKTTWSSDIGDCYTEYFYNGKWIHEEIFLNLSETEQDNFYKTVGKNPKKYFRDVPLKDLNKEIIYNTKNIWIGEVSWLKASLFESPETYVPNTIMRVAETIDQELEQLKEIDDALIESISKAFDEPNNTTYKLAKKKKVIDFLTKYKGKKCFTISW